MQKHGLMSKNGIKLPPAVSAPGLMAVHSQKEIRSGVVALPLQVSTPG